MQKKFSVVIVMMLICILAAGTAQARKWKISHVRPQNTAIDNDLKAFTAELEEISKGDMKAKIYAASSLGDYTVVQERVGLGAVDMACQPVAAAADKRMQIANFPFMFTGWKQAEKNFAPGAPLRKTIEGLYAKQGIKLLATWPAYFGGIALNKEPQNPTNPDAKKGLKIRVVPTKSFKLMADNIGFIGTPIPFSEAFTAVQTGVVDGVVGSGAEGYYASFRDVTKYYLPINTHFEMWYFIMNAELYEDLDEEHKKLLDKAAVDFENRRWARAEADQAANEKRLADYGAKIIKVSPEVIEAHAVKVRANVWPEILNDVGEDWGRKVLSGLIQ
jgi:TRAP-type C4-dicarboxylate transport system substrate-binding protein